MPAGRDPRAEPGSGSASSGGRERLRGGAGRALAAFLVGRCGGGQVLAGEGLASRRPGEPGTKRGGARGPWPPSSGALSSEHIASSRTGGAAAAAAAAGSGAGGEGAAAPPAAGRPPHCEAPAGLAGAEAARQTLHPGREEDGTCLSHKRQPSRPGAPRPYRLSFPSNLLGTRADARSREMPLLHRKPFVRQKPPGDLRPDEEVFYCKVTNEIFRHYE